MIPPAEKDTEGGRRLQVTAGGFKITPGKGQSTGSFYSGLCPEASHFHFPTCKRGRRVYVFKLGGC